MVGSWDVVGMAGKGLSYEYVNEAGSWTVMGSEEDMDLRFRDCERGNIDASLGLRSPALCLFKG